MSDIIYINSSIDKDGNILEPIPCGTLLKVEIGFDGDKCNIEKYFNMLLNEDKLVDNVYCPNFNKYIVNYNKNCILCILDSEVNEDYESYRYKIKRKIVFLFNIRNLTVSDEIKVDNFNSFKLDMAKSLLDNIVVSDVKLNYLLDRNDQATLLSFEIDKRSSIDIERMLKKNVRILKNDEMRLFRLCLLGVVDENIVKDYASRTLNKNILLLFDDIEFSLPEPATNKRKRNLDTCDFIMAINELDYDTIMMCLSNNIELQPGFEEKFVQAIEDLSYIDYDVDSYLLHKVVSWCCSTMQSDIIEMMEQRVMLPTDLTEEEKLNLEMIKARI